MLGAIRRHRAALKSLLHGLNLIPTQWVATAGPGRNRPLHDGSGGGDAAVANELTLRLTSRHPPPHRTGAAFAGGVTSGRQSLSQIPSR